MHSSVDHIWCHIIVLPSYYTNGDNDGTVLTMSATGNGYIKESDYVQLLENHGFKGQDPKLTLGNFQKISSLVGQVDGAKTIPLRYMLDKVLIL